MGRVLFISPNPFELKAQCIGYELEELIWPLKAVIGEYARANVENACRQITGLSKIDCIICEELHTAPVSFRLRNMGYDGPIILVPHTNPYPLGYILYSLLFSQHWGPNDTVITGSNTSARAFEELLGMRGSVIPTYGIDTSLYSQRDRKASRQLLGLSDSKLLLYTGRLAADKNIGGLLGAHRSLRRIFPEIALLICSHFKEEGYWNSLKNQLDETVVVKYLRREEMPYAYSAADLFVSCATSIYESFGRSPLESIACGTPVVVPEWNGFKDHINRRCGKLVRVDFLKEPTYEKLSYAMVNIPEFIETCIDMLSHQDTVSITLPTELSSRSSSKKIMNLLTRLIENPCSLPNRSNELRVDNPILRKVLKDLRINSVDKLYNSVLSIHEDFPHLGSELEKKMFFEVFDRRALVGA